MPRASYRPGAFSPKTRNYVLDRDGYRCRDCGKHASRLEVHHITPVSKGGTGEAANLITLCVGCHLARHRTIEDWRPPLGESSGWNLFRDELTKGGKSNA